MDDIKKKYIMVYVGYGYNWKEEEAKKNLLRTHTTAVSARMLYKLANQVRWLFNAYLCNSLIYDLVKLYTYWLLDLKT